MIQATRNRLNAKYNKVMVHMGVDRRAPEVAQPQVDEEVELKKDGAIKIREDQKKHH